MNAWGNEALHVGIAPFHARISAFQRVALILGRTGRGGSSIWVVGMAYDEEERVLLMGIPGLALAVNV